MGYAGRGNLCLIRMEIVMILLAMIIKISPEYPATWGGDEWRAGVQGEAIPLTGFPKGLKTPLVKGGVNASPAKCPCPKRRRCEGGTLLILGEIKVID